MINRNEFLEKKWVAYPEAKAGWMDVAEFCNSGKRANTVVAGRLLFYGQGGFDRPFFSLISNGSEIILQFHPSLAWMEPQASKTPRSQDETELSIVELLDDGDLIAVEGETQLSGSLLVKKILLLAPSIRQHSQTPSEFTVSRSQQWARFLNSIREFFSSAGFHEVTTPTLVPSPGTEPFLDPFKTEWELGSQKTQFYLPTSPEFHLKQLLVRGWTKIFEIKNCFRNGEISGHHQPEFLMLEWYRAYANLESIAQDAAALFKHLSQNFGISIPPLRRCTMPELFAAAFPGFKLEPFTTRDELAELAKQNQIDVSSDDTFDDIFFRLFLEKIEAGLGDSGPLLVSHYPPSQAALARIGEHGFAERFEIYWRGLELANAFHELNSPVENEARFTDDARKKEALGKPAVPRDENLVAAIRYGLPPSGGIALGVERLFMALFEIKKIEDARAFPIIPRPY